MTKTELRRKEILDAAGIQRSLGRLTLEIFERQQGKKDFAFIGIQKRGVPLAKRIAKKLKEMEKLDIQVGALDINLYRDDFSTVGTAPILRGTSVPFSVEDRTIILVDDVLFTGRTIRSALDAIVDLGRPRKVELAVFVDRGHRELPIQADYVGLSLNTRREDHVELMLVETDQKDALILESGDKR
jgi:pyrimidine operon attenuation protein / uracil phosphoribosyltransferase